MEHFYIFKGVDDFLEVTIVDKGEQDEKQQIGRCQFFLQSSPSFLFSNFEILYSDPGYLPHFRTSIDLTELAREKTHNLWLKLKDHVSGEFNLPKIGKMKMSKMVISFNTLVQFLYTITFVFAPISLLIRISF